MNWLGVNLVKPHAAQPAWKLLTRVLVCFALVGVVTYSSFSLLKVNALVASFAYLLVVLVVASRWGLIESTMASLAATLCLNFFFLPPLLTLTIADPQNWVALFVFMATSITATQLSSRARQRTVEAQAREAEVERLYELSRSLMMIDSGREVGVQIAEKVKQRFGFLTVGFCSGWDAKGRDGKVDFAGAPDPRLEPQILRDIASGEDSSFVWEKKDRSLDEIVTAPISLGGKVMGSLGAIGPAVSEPAWQAVANLASITVERVRTQAAASRMEAARQSESLKSLLLDALAHDFVTPLTSIKGAITTVRSEYPHTPNEEDLLAVVEEESDKLTGMVNETIDMARIESGRVQIRRRRITVADLVQSSLNHMASLLDATPTGIHIATDIPPINADPDLASLALRQLITNSVTYSPPGSKIEIAAVETNAMVTVTVSDEGPGIPPVEIEAIFERYYRGARTQHLAMGTGMGLSIARDIIAAHGGRIWAENKTGRGTQFSFTLPVAE
jgi:two-component system, OmpR family, sensor histidine kinase KdpD